MNKKLRTLLLTGVLFANLGGIAFAGNGNDGCQVPGLRGHESSNEHKVENITKESWHAWVDEVISTNTGIVVELQSNENGNGWVTWKVYKDEDFNHEKDNNHEIEVLHVKYNKVLTEEEKEEKNTEPVVPPTEPVLPPALPEEEPETGDASTIGFLVAGVLATLGLCKINKDEE